MHCRKLLSLCAIACIATLSANASAQQKLFVYTSMKESMIGGLKTAFTKKHPDIKIDYSTTTGSQSGYQQTLQTRISGGNLADVYIVPPEALSDLVKGNYAKDLSNESFMDKIGDAAKRPIAWMAKYTPWA